MRWNPKGVIPDFYSITVFGMEDTLGLNKLKFHFYTGEHLYQSNSDDVLIYENEIIE